MLRVRGGDAEAFATLYDRHCGLAFGIAVRICGRSVAEDVTQAIFLSVWNGRGTYRPSGSGFRGWLATISRNRSLDAMRRRSATPERPVGGDHDLEHRATGRREENVPHRTVERREAQARVRGALGQLPPTQREVVELAYFGGMTHSEIAAALGLPSGTVKSRMRLGLERLRRDPGVDELGAD